MSNLSACTSEPSAFVKVIDGEGDPTWVGTLLVRHPITDVPVMQLSVNRMVKAGGKITAEFSL